MTITSLVLLVNATNGDTAKPGYVLISANLKNKVDPKTKKEIEVPAALRYRNVWIPELSLPSVESKFVSALLVKFYELAKSQFTATMEDRSVQSVPSADYTIDGLLRYFELDAVSGRLTTDSVVAWFKTTATYSTLVPEKLPTWIETIGKFAAGNHSNNANTCRSVLAKIVTTDLDTPIGKVIADKCEKRIAESQSAAEL